MSKEQELYDRFVDVLLDKMNCEPSAKDLEVVMKFLQNQNIQASPTKHTGLNELSSKLPFDDDDTDSNILPLRVIK